MTYRLSSTFYLQLKQGNTYITNDGEVDVDYVFHKCKKREENDLKYR